MMIQTAEFGRCNWIGSDGSLRLNRSPIAILDRFIGASQGLLVLLFRMLGEEYTVSPQSKKSTTSRSLAISPENPVECATGLAADDYSEFYATTTLAGGWTAQFRSSHQKPWPRTASKETKDRSFVSKHKVLFRRGTEDDHVASVVQGPPNHAPPYSRLKDMTKLRCESLLDIRFRD